MCATFTPSQKQQIAGHFAVDPGPADQGLAFPGHMAPMIRAMRGDGPALACDPACFGLVPHWADTTLARSTYNARSETVAGKPSFREAWRRKQLCIIPVQDMFEHQYGHGATAPVRWRIERASKAPLAVAGIWDSKPGDRGAAPLLSFSMLTVNAAGHALMEQFNKPEDEKRMVVILDPAQYLPWLRGELMSSAALFRAYPATDLLGFPDPLRRSNPDQGDLF